MFLIYYWSCCFICCNPKSIEEFIHFLRFFTNISNKKMMAMATNN